MTPTQQLIWKDRADGLGKAIIFLLNSKNDPAKKDLRLIYAQGNHSAYLELENTEKMARLIASQYAYKKNNNPNNNPCTKKEDNTSR